MKKIVILSLIAFLFSAFKFIDSDDMVVKLDNLPLKRVVFTTYAENISALKVWDKVVGANDYVLKNELALKTNPNLKQIPSVGANLDINMEKIISLKPDAVFMWAIKKDLAKFINEKGILAISFKPLTIDDIYRDLYHQGVMLGVSDRANFVKFKMQEIFLYIDESLKNVKDKKVVAFTWASPTTITSINSVVGDIISKIKGFNPFANLSTPYANVGLEGLIRANPDVIFIWDGAVYDESYFLENRQLKSINAIKNKRVYKIPSYNSWGPRSAILALWMAYKIYPANFNEDEVKNMINSFNKDVFGVSVE